MPPGYRTIWCGSKVERKRGFRHSLTRRASEALTSENRVLVRQVSDKRVNVWSVFRELFCRFRHPVGS